jgi:hypothetical protein
MNPPPDAGPENPQPQNGAMMQQVPPPPSSQPNEAQAERLRKLRAAILKQRSQQQQGNQGDH